MVRKEYYQKIIVAQPLSAIKSECAKRTSLFLDNLILYEIGNILGPVYKEVG